MNIINIFSSYNMFKRFFCHFILVFLSIFYFHITFIIPISIAESNDNKNQKPLTDEMLIADFNQTPKKPGDAVYCKRGGQYGTWDLDPDDYTQTCTLSFSDDDIFKNGYSLELNYDVDSPNPAYNGFWLKLRGDDFTYYNTLNIFIRGDKTKGFTKRLKIELKDFEKTAAYVIDGITKNWQKYSIPFEKYRRIKNWSNMNEFVIVFDDIISKPKTGTIFIDHITISREPVSSRINGRRRVKRIPLKRSNDIQQ